MLCYTRARFALPTRFGDNMTELNSFVNTTLLADDNQASISAMLDAILAKPLTPMEAKQAKTYMEQVATQAAGEDRKSVV